MAASAKAWKSEILAHSFVSSMKDAKLMFVLVSMRFAKTAKIRLAKRTLNAHP